MRVALVRYEKFTIKQWLYYIIIVYKIIRIIIIRKRLGSKYLFMRTTMRPGNDETIAEKYEY